MGLTRKQKDRISEIIDARTEKVLEGRTSFRMEDYDCQRWFGVQNDTFHRPSCNVERISDGKAYVEAVFFGSGVMSHPVRRGYVPVSEISGDYPMGLYYWYSFINLFNRKKGE